MQDFGEQLRNTRIARHLTQEQLAEMADITRVMIARYETTSQLPALDTLIRIADALDVSIDYLLGRADASGVYQEKGVVIPPSAQRKKGGLPATREELEQLIQDMVQSALKEKEQTGSKE